jgi:Lrp/AsnC family leucine-responsive transcriptional regulator
VAQDVVLKLDVYDKKILLRLYRNSRESTTSIGRHVHLRRENVDYRIKKLQNLGMIKEYNTYFNEMLLDLKRGVFLVQLINLRGETEIEIMNFLKKHHGTTWIGPTAGKWSIIFDVVIKNDKKFTEVMKNFFTKYEKNIGEYIFISVEESEVFFQKIFSDVDYSQKKIQKKTKNKKLVLDDIDWKILRELNNDARISYAILSSKIKLTANAIKKRIKLLENSGIIENYTISLDFRKLGYDWYTLNLNLTKFDDDTEKRLKMFFKEHKKVIFYCRDNGAWEYDVGIFAKNSDELRVFINELRSKFSEEIKIRDVFVTLEEVKGYKLPYGVFE